LPCRPTLFVARGIPLPGTKSQAIAWVGQLVADQATGIAYRRVLDLVILALLIIPVALSLRPPAAGRPAERSLIGPSRKLTGIKVVHPVRAIMTRRHTPSARVPAGARH
jgi:hypothetical protein